jgi:hypothetical protein
MEGPARVSPLKIAASRAMKIPEVSDEARAEYEYELIELAGRYMEGDEDMSTAQADRLALDDMGCVEFWDLAREREGNAAARVNNCSQLSRHRENVFCSRCQSVGHLVEACPFSVSDEFVTKIAVQRRERRAAHEVAA